MKDSTLISHLRVSQFSDQSYFTAAMGLASCRVRARGLEAIQSGFNAPLLLCSCQRDYPGRAAEQVAHSPDEIYIFPCSLRRWPYGDWRRRKLRLGIMWKYVP